MDQGLAVTSSSVASRSRAERRLCRSFVRAACRTWRLVCRGARHGLMPSEETLTDLNLLDIRSRNPSSVWIWRMSKWEEGKKSGADWEWWVGRQGAWVGMRIQAKLLRPGQAAPLRTTVGYRNGSQLARLLKSSASARVFPLYCFYNAEHWWPWTWHVRCCACRPIPAAFGCALVPAPLFQASWQREWLDCRCCVFPWAVPWSCLVCPESVGASGDPFAERVYRLLRELFQRLDFEPPELAGELPGYILDLQEGRRPRERPDVARILVVHAPE